MSVFRINPNQDRKIKFFSVDIKHKDLETYEDIELALSIVDNFISNKASDSELISINERLVNAVYTLIGESKDNDFETNQLKEEIIDLEDENKQLKNELDHLDEEYDGLQSEYSLSEMVKFDISEKILNYEAEIRELQSVIDEKDEKLNEIEKLKSEINIVDEIAMELREVIAKRDGRINDLVDEITDLRTIIADRDNTIKNMEKSILKFKETFIYVRDSIIDLDNHLDNNFNYGEI